MEAHIVRAQGHAPKLLTVATEAKALARETEGTPQHITFGSTKPAVIEDINRLLAEAYEAGRAETRQEFLKLKPETVQRIAAGLEQVVIRPDALPSEAFGRMSAGPVMARSDNPEVNYDGIVDTIRTARGAMLRGFAGAVACAFAKLEGGQG